MSILNVPLASLTFTTAYMQLDKSNRNLRPEQLLADHSTMIVAVPGGRTHATEVSDLSSSSQRLAGLRSDLA